MATVGIKGLKTIKDATSRHHSGVEVQIPSPYLTALLAYGNANPSPAIL